MVKYRGIDVSIVSQFDIQRLPEFHGSVLQDHNESNAVNCYVPIYPGSQIWFEYTVEPPIPPKAAFFFKLLINRQPITAWDCTEKHGYHGKTIYILEKMESQHKYPKTSVQRRGFQFCNHAGADASDENTRSDCMEIRVHRIEHRRRIYGALPHYDRTLDSRCGGQLQLINGGSLEPGRPRRRYKYQLLDPVDEPYAVFRFFYRTYDYLWQNNIILTPGSSSCSISSSSMAWHDAYSTSFADIECASEPVTGLDTQANQLYSNSSSSSPKTGCTRLVRSTGLSPTLSQRSALDTYLPPSDSDESLCAVIRDSIEDLPSTVPRSPEFSRSKRFSLRSSVKLSESPTRQSLSPRQKLKKRLTLDLDGTTLNIKNKRGPLSPFTSSGFLRRMMSPEPPPPAPVITTQFGPPLADAVAESTQVDGTEFGRNDSHLACETVQNECSGTPLIRILSRRLTRKNDAGEGGQGE